MNDVDRRSPAWVVALVFAVHITLWSVVFLSLIYILPRYHKIFLDFGMRLPLTTEKVIEVSTWFKIGRAHV